jgi:hypothetical protein
MLVVEAVHHHEVPLAAQDFAVDWNLCDMGASPTKSARHQFRL